ncbi:hypothetical protein [Microlunatus flavus]|uniref:Uncharacterized protein n=1 Tax=Microlunatus flavus TaxID=1036181 RepID=A0A1H9KA88_9ACTN|nr:hypothetical protein [Microlunatus flavus]SEQ95813.1 hypothetical protein SAMN05421756_107117 [Microlunatus flavus]
MTLVALLGLGGVGAGVVHDRQQGAEGGSTVAPTTGTGPRSGGFAEGQGRAAHHDHHRGDSGDTGAGAVR